VGFPTKNTAVTSAITTLPRRAWAPGLAADGEVRDNAEVAEVTGLWDLSRWPAGMRVIVRREHPHLGAQLLFEQHVRGLLAEPFQLVGALADQPVIPFTCGRPRFGAPTCGTAWCRSPTPGPHRRAVRHSEDRYRGSFHSS
jgi:hypothetical protein